MLKKIAITLLLLACRDVYAYGTRVHEKITERAFNRLTFVDFRSRMGVDRTHRIGGKFLQVLMSEGSHDEDDLLPLPRPLNHFYDPAHGGLPLAIPLGYCIPRGLPALNWMMLRDFNNFSIPDAQEHYYLSLIGPNPGTRDVHLRELFLALGHAVHLVQDMAQPEHTRNDQHLPYSHLLLLGPKSAGLYEDWGDSNLASDTPAVSFDGYTIPRLPSYASYFHTADNKGLADYSNRNFMTQDTNYHDEMRFGNCRYYLEAPAINADGTPRDAVARTETVKEHVRDHIGGEERIEDVDMDIFAYMADDRLTRRQDVDAFHTYRSSLDLETEIIGRRVYSLGPRSFASRAKLLIPRAVGYSAGLVERFFRGRLDASWSRDSFGKWRVDITNTSAEKIGGDSFLVVAYRPGAAYLGTSGSDDLAIILNTTLSRYAPDGLTNGQTVSVTGLDVPGLHQDDLLTEFERRIVIYGSLGTEAMDGLSVSSLVQPATQFEETYTVDCWSGATPTCPLLSGLYSTPETGFVPADVGRMNLYPHGIPVTTSCGYSDSIPPGSRISYVEATLYLRTFAAPDTARFRIGLNSYSFYEVPAVFNDGCQSGAGVTTNPMVVTTGVIFGPFPAYAFGGANTVTVTGVIPGSGGSDTQHAMIEAVKLRIGYTKP